LLSLKQAGVYDVPDVIVRASTGFAGGGGGKKEVCGAVIAGIQAIGLKHGRVDKSVDRKAAMEPSGLLVADFKERFGTVSCRELVKEFPDFNNPERKEHCAQFVETVAEWLGSFLPREEKKS